MEMIYAPVHGNDRYYLNGVDAFRLKLPLPPQPCGKTLGSELESDWVEMAGIEPTVQKLQIA